MAWKERGTNETGPRSVQRSSSPRKSRNAFSRIPQRFFGDTFPVLLLRPRDQHITLRPEIINPRTGGGGGGGRLARQSPEERVIACRRQVKAVSCSSCAATAYYRSSRAGKWHGETMTNQKARREGEREEQEASRFVHFFFFPFISIFEKKKKKRKGPLAGYIYKTRCIRLAFPTMLHFSSILHGWFTKQIPRTVRHARCRPIMKHGRTRKTKHPRGDRLKGH